MPSSNTARLADFKSADAMIMTSVLETALRSRSGVCV